MKFALSLFVMLTVIINFSNCSSAQKLQTKIPFSLDEVYYQNWISEADGGDSGTNLHLSLKDELPENIQLDSVYFTGKVAKLEVDEQQPLQYVGRFVNQKPVKKDLVMSNEPNAEYGNTLPVKMTKIPFELQEDECVISYKERGSTKYFKLSKVFEKKQ